MTYFIWIGNQINLLVQGHKMYKTEQPLTPMTMASSPKTLWKNPKQD